MTDNMKKFLSRISEDQEAAERFSKSEKDALIAEAKEMGIELTDADFAPEENALSDDELEAVAGGGKCTCVAGGGGTKGTNDRVCACILGGTGSGHDPKNKLSDDGHATRCRCACNVYGSGTSLE